MISWKFSEFQETWTKSNNNVLNWQEVTTLRASCGGSTAILGLSRTWWYPRHRRLHPRHRRHWPVSPVQRPSDRYSRRPRQASLLSTTSAPGKRCRCRRRPPSSIARSHPCSRATPPPPPPHPHDSPSDHHQRLIARTNFHSSDSTLPKNVYIYIYTMCVMLLLYVYIYNV